MVDAIPDWPEENILVCRGKEFAGRGQIDRTWSAMHVPGLFVTEAPPAPAAMSMQDWVDWVADPLHSYVADGHGGLSVVAHSFLCLTPEFHGSRPAHLNKDLVAKLRGLHAIEIAHHGACGFADRLWDELLNERLERGAPLLWGFGADDTHFGHSGNLGLSWTASKLRRFNTWELKRSMREGAVYTTNGLHDLDIHIANDEIVVTSREPVDVRWLMPGQYFTSFGLEGFTRHGFTLEEEVAREQAMTIVHPVVVETPGPNHCLREERNVAESRFRTAEAASARFIRCILLRGADLKRFSAEIDSGERFKPGVPPRERPMIVKAFFMPIRCGADGRFVSQYPEHGTWVTGATHNHCDLFPNELHRADEYFSAYRAAGHLAAFETGYTLVANPFVHYPAGATPRVVDVRPAATTAAPEENVPLLIDGSGFNRDAAVLIGGRAVTETDWCSSTSLRVNLPADLACGVHDVTVRNPQTPYRHTLAEGCVLRPADARTAGWRTYGLAQGLPDPHVYCVAKGRGCIWIGTNNGLACLREGKCTADQAGAVVVESLCAGSDQSLWACGYDGVFRRDSGGQWRRFTTDDGLRKASMMNSVFRASDGAVYLTCHSPAFIARFDGKQWIEEHREREVKRWLASNITEGRDQRILAGSVLHTGLQRTAAGWTPIGLPDLSAWLPRRLYQSPSGRLVAATMAQEEAAVGGVCLLQDGNWRATGREQGLPHHRVWDLAFEPDDTIWAATAKGLARIDPQGNVSVYTCLNSGLPSDRVNTVEVFDGTLWVGTERGLASLALCEKEEPPTSK